MALALAIVAATTSASGQVSSGNQTQGQARWYDAYRQGVAAAQRRDWATAEKLLLEAGASRTTPGRRTFAYGDTYIDYLPDYYLGIVYLNTNRDREAEAAFQRVRAQGLIGAKDPEYTAFERQGRQATFNRAFTEAQQLLAKGDFTQATSRLDQARSTGIDDAKVTALSSEISGRMATARTDRPSTAPTQVATPPPLPAPIQPSGTTAGSVPTVSTAPSAFNPDRGAIIASRADVTPPRAGPVAKLPTPMKQTSAALRNGLLAFFSGDYDRAIPMLASAAQEPGALPRAQVYLACAKVGLVLSGRGDAAMLREARASFQRADAQRTLSATDRRFISPRVLQQLETP